MTTQKIAIQPLNVRMGEVKQERDGVYVYSTQEYRRALDQMAKLVNAQQASIEAINARLVAGGL